MTHALTTFMPLLQGAFRLFQTKLPRFLLLSVLFFFALVLLSPMTYFARHSFLEPNATLTLFVSSFLITLFFQLWFQGAVMLSLDAPELRFRELLTRSLARFWQFFLATLIVLVIAALPLLLTLWHWVSSVDPGAQLTLTLVTTPATAVAAVFATAWLLYVIVYFLFVPYEVVLGHQKAWNAVQRSFRLTRGRWSSLFFHFFFFTILLTIVSLILRLIPGLGQLIVLLLAAPLSTTFFYQLYRAHTKGVKAS